MGNNTNDQWLSRQQVADRYGLPVKTLAQWASKGTGPRFALMGRHVRYRLSDIIDWEEARLGRRRQAAEPMTPTRHPLDTTADAASEENTGRCGSAR